MYNFIILGLIPGTNIQLTFNYWLTALGIIALLLSFRRVRAYIIRLQIAHVIEHADVDARRITALFPE